MPYVVLNDKRIDIVGKVKERTISPWTAKITSGNADFGSFQPCDILEYANLRGGIGIENTKDEGDRYWFAESMETTKERYMTLGPLVVDTGSMGTPPIKILDFGSNTMFIGSSVVYYWSGTTLTNCADTNALANVTDAIVVKDATATYLVTCNGSDVRYCITAFGTGKDWATLSTSDIKYLAYFDKRLIGVNASGTAIYYSDQDNIDDAAGGAMDTFSISGPWTAVYDLFTGLDINTSSPALFMVTDAGLVWIDFWVRAADLMEVRYPKTTTALCGLYWNSEIYIGTGAGICKVGSSLVTQYGPDEDDGLPTDNTGYVYDMIGISHWVICVVSGGTISTILKRHESLGGWHPVYQSYSPIRAIYHSSLTSPGKLWFGEENNIKYILLPDKTHDVTKTSGYTFAATGNIIFSKFSKLSVIPKTAVKIEALTEGCTATETIAIYIRKDSTTSWGDAVGTITTNGHSVINLGSSAGLSFYDIQIGLWFSRGSTTTLTPILKSLALKYVPNPPAVQSWSFAIAARGAEAKEIITNLEAARDSTTLVDFSPAGDLNISTKWVKVEQLPSQQQGDVYDVEKDYTVVVSEVG